MTITKVAAVDLAVVLLQRVPATSRALLSSLLLLSQAHRTCLLLCWAQFRSHTTLQRGEPYKYGSLMLKAFNQVPIALILTSPPPSPVCRAPTKSCPCSFSCIFLTGESVSSRHPPSSSPQCPPESALGVEEELLFHTRALHPTREAGIVLNICQNSQLPETQCVHAG